MYHTGIKTEPHDSTVEPDQIFQLYHTGIKTVSIYQHFTKIELFQLYHTGIKTPQGVDFLEGVVDFNCTIQELKLRRVESVGWWQQLFQLYHTGIKT